MPLELLRRHSRLAALFAVLALVACAGGAAASHRTLHGDVAPIRAAFNADSGKVRALFLASPT